MLVPFIIKYSEETDAVELIKTLLLLLPCDFIHGHGLYNNLFEALFDIVSCIMDDLPRKHTKILLSWLRDNAAHFVTSKSHYSRISTILPFLSHSKYLSMLISTTDGENIFKKNFKPWYWTRGISKFEVKGPWNSERQAKQLNDTCISLSLFGAEVLKPSKNDWETKIDNGWSPPLNYEEKIEDDCFSLDISKIDLPSKRKGVDVENLTSKIRMFNS